MWSRKEEGEKEQKERWGGSEGGGQGRARQGQGGEEGDEIYVKAPRSAKCVYRLLPCAVTIDMQLTLNSFNTP